MRCPVVSHIPVIALAYLPGTLTDVILLVNDDGIEGPGLRALYHSLRAEFKQPVLAVAPCGQRSGQGHAITINRSLSAESHWDAQGDFFGFAVDGTPTDCCKLGLKVIAPQPPQMVISGINDGPNVGRSIFYSGTVGAAMEAAVEGHCALAVSLDRCDHPNWEEAAAATLRVLRSLWSQRTTLRGTVINLNLPALPAAEWGALRLVPHGLSGFEERYSLHRLADGSLTWRLHGERIELAHEGETDAHALRAGHPTISLLHPKLNASEPVLSDALAQRLARALSVPAAAQGVKG